MNTVSCLSLVFFSSINISLTEFHEYLYSSKYMLQIFEDICYNKFYQLSLYVEPLSVESTIHDLQAWIKPSHG